MRRSAIALSVIALFGLGSCASTSTIDYFPDGSNTRILTDKGLPDVWIDSAFASSEINMNCRAFAVIPISGGRTLDQLIRYAFNEEFDSAGLTDTSNRVPLTLELEYADFSSQEGMLASTGWWAFLITLKNERNGEELSVESRHEFRSAYDGVVGCERTAQALTPAIRGLIRETISDDRFTSLVN